MRHVLLVTHMYSPNSGDLLIAESIVSNISSRQDWGVERLPFLYYNGMAGNRWLNGLLGVGRVFNALRRNEVVVVAGGNLVIPRVMRFAVSFALYALLSRILRKPMYVAFMGASSRTHWLGTPICRFGLRTAKQIWTRDEHSVEVINELAGRNDALVSADGAFFSPYRCGAAQDFAAKRIAVVPFDHQELFWNERLTQITRDEYESQYHDVVRSMKNNGWEVKIIVTAEADRKMGEQLAQIHDLQISQPKDGESLLRTICREVDVLVSTRMHGLIAGLLCGKGVVPVGGQHKVRSLFEEISPGTGRMVQKIAPGLSDRVVGCVEERQWIVLSADKRQEFLERLDAVWNAIDDDLSIAS